MRTMFMFSAVLAALSLPSVASAQEGPCRDGVMAVGPGVVVRSPLGTLRVGPLVEVRVRRCRRRVAQVVPPPPPAAMQPPPPPPAMQPPPPPPRYRVRVVTAPPPPRRVYIYPRRRYQRIGLTLGAFGDGTFYKKGGMGGGGLMLRWRLDRNWALTTTFEGAGSCTRCVKDAKDYYRRDLTWTAGVMYFPFPRLWFAPYAQTSLMVNEVHFKAGGDVFKVSQFGLSTGLGVEWRINRWLALFTDANLVTMFRAKRNHDVELQGPTTGSGQDYDANMKGIPQVHNSDVGASIRAGLVIKF